ncbi:MAG: NYN domain-containing protein [Thermoanaerobaculum sp.]|nr:NYN domain-containing protein [Thermoanaerobaculum sp.]
MFSQTAIFYDLENLLKGYALPLTSSENVPFRGILHALRGTGEVGRIVVQKAYANWADPRLSILKADVTELGIEPVQVFGFGRDGIKNAADIQLAIDAMDLVHHQPAVDVIVIVSGDGIFAALARKLREHGRKVLGCAYRSAAHHTFQAICDVFVSIDEPPEHTAETRGLPSQEVKAPGLSDPRNLRLAKNISRAIQLTVETVQGKIREILLGYVQDPTSRNSLLSTGIPLSTVKEAVGYFLPDFQPMLLGFSKFMEFMQCTCANSDFCIARRGDSEVVLVKRHHPPADAQPLPDLEPRPLHTPPVYLAILKAGKPSLTLPPPDQLVLIAELLANLPCHEVEAEQAVASLLADHPGRINPHALNLTLASLAEVGVLSLQPAQAPLGQQKLQLRAVDCAPVALLRSLRQAAERKIQSFLSKTDPEVLANLIPLPPTG